MLALTTIQCLNSSLRYVNIHSKNADSILNLRYFDGPKSVDMLTLNTIKFHIFFNEKNTFYESMSGKHILLITLYTFLHIQHDHKFDDTEEKNAPRNEHIFFHVKHAKLFMLFTVTMFGHSGKLLENGEFQ